MVKYINVSNEDILDGKDKNNAGEISRYMKTFMADHKASLSDFNKNCFEVVSRILWRYEKYGFYKENLPK